MQLNVKSIEDENITLHKELELKGSLLQIFTIKVCKNLNCYENWK